MPNININIYVGREEEDMPDDLVLLLKELDEVWPMEEYSEEEIERLEAKAFRELNVPLYK